MIGSSIIVYRNPAEQVFWESLMNGSNTLVIFVALSAFLFAFVATHLLLSRVVLRNAKVSWNAKNGVATWVAFGSASLLSIALATFMWI
jgi:hypothetical protein